MSPRSVSLLILLALSALACPASAREPFPLTPTQAERTARPAVDRAAGEVQSLETKLKGQATRLKALEGETDRLLRERQQAEDEIAALSARLKTMLPELWAMDVRLKGIMDASLAPWAETDRGLTWMGAVFDSARADMERLRLRNSEFTVNLARENELRPEAAAQAAQVEKTRDDLMAARLKLLKELETLRGGSPSPLERLERILDAADLTAFSPAGVRDKPMDSARGVLPWPVKGSVTAAFDPAAKPPRPGIVLSAPAGTRASCVHWGRVAFAGEVPGLGQVAVVAHGNGYFSVYSNLSRLDVKPGQDLTRGEEIGVVGATGTGGTGGPGGMSFELRFGGKPINPSRWLKTG